VPNRLLTNHPRKVSTSDELATANTLVSSVTLTPAAPVSNGLSVLPSVSTVKIVREAPWVSRIELTS
jgi:hypothetical protein